MYEWWKNLKKTLTENNVQVLHSFTLFYWKTSLNKTDKVNKKSKEKRALLEEELCIVQQKCRSFLRTSWTNMPSFYFCTKKIDFTIWKLKIWMLYFLKTIWGFILTGNKIFQSSSAFKKKHYFDRVIRIN